MSTATAERTRVLGIQTPRIFTPPRRELTAETSHGFACIAFAEQVLGISLFPWQQWLLIHGLELNEDGTYRFRYVVVEVARQSGKSFILLVLALWHLYVQDSPTVIGTAQDLARADKAWEEAVEWAQSNEELAELIEQVYKGHPKLFRLAKTDEIPWYRDYRVASTGRRGGRGFSGDLILLDELREHQSWESWSAVTNTMNARPRAQAWAFSNAGDIFSVVLRYLRALAHRELGWPDGDADSVVLETLDAEMEAHLAEHDTALGWFEWSAPPGTKRNDIKALAQANPSMNHTDVVADCITERALLAALRTSPPHEFDTEVRCIWLSTANSGPFPEGSWAATLDNDARPAPESAWRPICVDVSWNRSRTYVARAAFDTEDRVIVGIAADRAGTEWVIPWLIEHRESYDTIVVQSNGAPVTSLMDAMESALLPDGKTPANLPVLKWGGPDLGIATGTFYGLLDAENGPLRLRHLAHPGLDAAATTAVPKVLAQGAWVIDRMKSPTDAAPLQAVMGAAWGLLHNQPQTVEVWGFYT